MKRLSLVLLMVALLAMTIVPQIAQARVSDIIDNYNVKVEALSDGRISAKATATAAANTSKLGFPTILIQEYNGSSWVTKKTVSGKYGSGTDYSYTAYYQGTAGEKYRARTSCTATFDGATDTRPLKTSSNTVVGK
ncbi:MAG: hypothetical protein RSD95_16980 [Clostridia bacterium]